MGNTETASSILPLFNSRRGKPVETRGFPLPTLTDTTGSLPLLSKVRQSRSKSVDYREKLKPQTLPLDKKTWSALEARYNILTKCLKDPNFYVRLCAVEALEKLRIKKALPTITRMLADPQVRVRIQAAKYLVKQL